MNKQITSIFLVAGTCIGAGMFALPLTFAKIGIIPSIIIIILTWLFTYNNHSNMVIYLLLFIDLCRIKFTL